MRAELDRRGWTVLGVASLISLINTGYPYYGASVLNAVMAQQLSIERSLLGLGFTLMLLIQGLCAPAITRAMQVLGIRATVTLGSLLLAAGAALMASWVHGGWSFVLAFGAVVGIGTGLSTYIPTQTLVAQWFDRRRAMAFSLVMAVGGLGGFVVSPLLGWMLARNGGDWRAVWWMVSMSVLVVAAVSALLLRERREPADAGSAQPAASLPASDGWTARALLRTPLLWIVILGEVAVGMPVMSFFAHGVAHLRELGHSAEHAALAVGLMAGASILGQFLAGLLGDRLDPRHLWCASLLAVFAGVALSIRADTLLAIYVFSIVLGAGYGAGLICKSLVIGRYFGTGGFALVMGTMAPVSISLSALSPYLIGLSYDALGSYTIGLAALAALALVAAFTQLLAGPPRHAALAAIHKEAA
jgi:MFS family permease